MKKSLASVVSAILFACCAGESASQDAKITPSKVLAMRGKSVCTDRSRESLENQKAYRAVEAYIKQEGKDPSGLFMVVADDGLFYPPQFNTITVYVRGPCNQPVSKRGGEFYVVWKHEWRSDGGLPPDISYMAPHWIRENSTWYKQHGYFEH